MEIRPIRPEERMAASKVQAIAFLFARDFSEIDHCSPEASIGFQTCRGAFDDTGRLCSCLELIPFQTCFDGHLCGMSGIGGVATLPELRGKGYIRRLFEGCMEEMYERGDVFSFLYPFSHPYYRKFGYELNMLKRHWVIPVSALSVFPFTGKMKLWTPGQDSCSIRRLYRYYSEDKNLTVLRDETRWKQILEKDPYKDNKFLYIWSDTDNEARGYVYYGIQQEQEQRKNIEVYELIYHDQVSLRSILGFLSALSHQVEKLIWKGPEYLDLLPYFPEPHSLKQEIVLSGMNRVVHVQKALSLLRVPKGSGSVKLSVTDEFFPRNTGIYEFAWDRGGSEVCAAGGTADFECDVQAFSQLVTGFADLTALISAGRAAGYGNLDAALRLLRRKKLYINDYF